MSKATKTKPTNKTIRNAKSASRAAGKGARGGSALKDDELDGVTGGTTVATHAIVSPRDAASGLPTGKRQHKPVSF